MPTAKKSTLSFVGIILLANSYLALGETDSRNFSASGNMFVEITKFNKAKKSKQDLTLLLKCARCPGIDGYLPTTETTSIWIMTNNGQFVLPKSLVADLYNLHVGSSFVQESFKATKTRAGLKAQISGGDGSGSYKVKYDIDLINYNVKRYLSQYPYPDKMDLREGRASFIPAGQ